MSADLKALREYVLADTGAQQRADSTVLLSVSHSNLRTHFMELRFDLHVRLLAAFLFAAASMFDCLTADHLELTHVHNSRGR
jgi:hypothetical protein